MKTYNNRELLQQLKAEVTMVLDTVQQLVADERMLNCQPAPGKWSIAQIIEHLNTYNRYYLAYAAATIPKAAKLAKPATFKPGWLGDYFTRSMYSEVVTAKKVTNKMNALKGHRPDSMLDAAAVIPEFIHDEKRLLQLLDDAMQVDMSSVRIPVTISKWIRISLGDALRFLVAHQVRHLLQLNNTLAVVKEQCKEELVAC